MTSRPRGVVHVGRPAGYFKDMSPGREAEAIAAETADLERSGYQVLPVPQYFSDLPPSHADILAAPMDAHAFGEPCQVCRPVLESPPYVVSLADIADMAGVSKVRAGQIMDRRTHPSAPPPCEARAGRVWYRSDVIAYLTASGREKTWED